MTSVPSGDDTRGGDHEQRACNAAAHLLHHVMRIVMIGAAVMMWTAAPVFAEEHSTRAADPNGYVQGLGGFATSVGNTTGDVLVEGGVRVAPHLIVFGNAGRFTNVRADLQPTLDATTSSLATNQGLTVIGGGKLPASYFSGGLRAEVPTNSRLAPYVLGGIGVAHLNPTTQFTFSSGMMPDGSTPDIGTDVTSALISAGALTPPSASNALMYTLGGGVEARVATHWTVDAGYRYSRIAADSTLSASPLNVNGMTFGFGYRF